MKYLIIYFVIINILSFLIFYIDKQKAKKNKYRISEKFLLILILLAPPLGAFASMKFFHHKTKKIYFYIFIILSIIIWYYTLKKINI